MVEQARATGPVLVVDAGRSLVKAERGVIDPAAVEQLRGKARVVVRALVASKVDAMAVGGPDWALGAAFVRSLLVEEGAPVLAANLVCDGARPFPGSKVVEVGGRRVGVIGLTVGEVEGCEVEDAGEALSRALSELGDVALRVVLLPTEAPATRAALERVTGVDLVVDAHATRQGAAEQIGGAWVVGSGPRGQHVGLTRLIWREGAQGWAAAGHSEQLTADADRVKRRIESLERRKSGAEAQALARAEELQAKARAELAELERTMGSWEQTAAGKHLIELSVVPLDDTVADAPGVLAEVQALLSAMASGEVGQAVVVAAERRADSEVFAGAAVCAGCHPAITASWEQTAHARAWQTLVDDQHAADHACFACHATGVGAEGGPSAPAEVGGLRDVQCEACHGPSLLHAKAPTEHRPVKSPSPSTCTGCHDGERDRGRFDLGTYLPKVAHTEGPG